MQVSYAYFLQQRTKTCMNFYFYIFAQTKSSVKQKTPCNCRVFLSFYVIVFRLQPDLNRSEKVCASCLGCCGAEENGAADFVDFFAGVVDVDVSCCGSDQHKIVFHSNHSFRITTETFALITV